jgi:hypothetical protein
MMATVRHVASEEERTKFQAVWFLLDRVYRTKYELNDTRIYA